MQVDLFQLILVRKYLNFNDNDYKIQNETKEKKQQDRINKHNEQVKKRKENHQHDYSQLDTNEEVSERQANSAIEMVELIDEKKDL